MRECRFECESVDNAEANGSTAEKGLCARKVCTRMGQGLAVRSGEGGAAVPWLVDPEEGRAPKGGGERSLRRTARRMVWRAQIAGRGSGIAVRRIEGGGGS